MRLQQIFWTGITALIITGCSSSSAPETPDPSVDPVQMAKLGPELPDDTFGQHLEQCYGLFAKAEKQRRESNVHYMGYFRVPGYPYIRVDRLMASYAGNLSSEAQAGPWLEQMREYASFARAVELRDIGMESVERANLLHELSLCSVWLTLFTFDQAEARSRMVKAIRESVPPPAKPVKDRHGKTSNPSTAKLIAWEPQAPEDAASDEATNELYFEACDRDELGRVGLYAGGWQRLAARYAPTVLSPRPLVSPRFDKDGKILNSGPAQINYQPSFIRAGGQTLLQFSYFIWTAHDQDDTHGFRGLIWRVTLAPDATPLVYDSLNLDSTDHGWHPARQLDTQVNVTVDNSLVDAEKVVLTLATDGSLERASPGDLPSDLKPRKLLMTLYDDLAEMPLPGGGERSMFDSDGQLRVQGPPVYMLGQHPAIDKSRRAFDDPYLVDSVFELDSAALAEAVPDACKKEQTVNLAQ